MLALAETPADSVSVEIHSRQIFCALNPQVSVSSALHDSVDALSFICFNILTMRREASFCPAMCPIHRLFLVLVIRIGCRTFIECINDIGTERVLYLDGTLRSKTMQCPVVV